MSSPPLASSPRNHSAMTSPTLAASPDRKSKREDTATPLGSPVRLGRPPSDSTDANSAVVRTRQSSQVPYQANISDYLITPSPSNFVPSLTDVDALSFLFNTVVSFSEAQRDTARGWHADLRDVYNEQGDGSLVQTAARATSLALLGAGRQNSSMVRDGLVVHGESLTKLREALQDPSASRSDATLMAVMLMSHFDFIVGAHEGRPYLDAHGRILPALLRHRGLEQLEDPRARRLFYNIQLQVLNSRLYGGSHFGELDDILLLPDDSDHPGAKLNNMLKRIYHFQHRVAQIKTERSASKHVQHALDDAFRIDTALVDWSSSLRPNWQFSILSAAEAKVKPHQYWKVIHAYSDIWICRIWNSYRTARIELLTSTWNLMIWASANHGTDHSDQQLRSQQVIQRMVDDVSASIPYGLGDVATSELQYATNSGQPRSSINYKAHAASMGWFLLNPIIRVCLKAPHIPENQRDWLKAQLVRCCKLGMMQAGKGDHEFLIRQRQPVFAYSMPIVILNDEQANEHELLSPSPSLEPLRDRSSEPSTSPPIEKSIEEDEPGKSSQKSDNTDSGLKFINTTRPGQTKDEGVQKKIRRDVMLDYHRKNTRKKLAERMQHPQSDRPKSAVAGSSKKPT